MKFKIFLSMLLLAGFMVSCDNKTSTENEDDSHTSKAITEPSKSEQVLKVDLSKSLIGYSGIKIEQNGEKDIHGGEVKLKEGSLKLDAAGNLIGGDFSVDMLSIINTDLPEGKKSDMEKHLKSVEFFDADKFATAAFSIKKVSANENEGEFSVSGSLAVRDMTRDLSFDVRMEHDAHEVRGTAEIHLTHEDFGLTLFPAEIILNVILVAPK